MPLACGDNGERTTNVTFAVYNRAGATAALKVPFAVRAYQSEFDQMKTYDSDAEPSELLLK